MKEITEIGPLPYQISSQGQKIGTDRAVLHDDSAQYEVAADVMLAIEGEAPGFICEDEIVWHENPTRWAATRCGKAGDPMKLPEAHMRNCYRVKSR